MATLKPFRILHPQLSTVADICTLPYDVMNTDEARQMAEGKPLSFLRVTRSEIEFPAEANPYSDEVYQHGAANLRKLIDQGALVQEANPIYMLYRQVMGNHTQLGLVAVANCADYDAGTIKKHELTRPDKEDDRTRHINILRAQTGPVFLTYKAQPEIDTLLNAQVQKNPDLNFVAEDGIRHSAWLINDTAVISAIQKAFGALPALYVADGHHRSAAASRVARERTTANTDHSGSEPYNYFLTVSFPHNQMQILGYNRLVKDLNGLSPQQVLEKLERLATVSDAPPSRQPSRKGELTMFLAGKWYLLRWKADAVTGNDAVAKLDVSVLQNTVLTPLFNIGDPRIDKRIQFIGGIRGPQELELLVTNGSGAVAFALYPTSIEDLMEIADAGGLMPPKSTWFEPKLRDGMAVHLI
ncbi:MAG: DUF1015 domain-containing protein [Candidatus Sumerlaeaceae bacterium]